MLVYALTIALTFAQAAAAEPEFEVQGSIIKEGAYKIPKLTVHSGQTANIRDQSQTPFVTAVKEIDEKTQQPVITILSAGIAIDVTVTRHDDTHAVVDLVVTDSEIGKAEERLVNKEKDIRVQSPRVESTQVRTIDCVRLGEKNVVTWGGRRNGRSFEYVVRRR